MSTETFEADRIAWFGDCGAAVTGTWLQAGDGRRTYALDTGGAGTPTLLVHGGLSEASVWAQMAGHLDGRVVIPDRPGCGLSDSVDYTGVDYRAHATGWLLGLVDALGLEHVDLVGNSMGGYFAMAFALAHPDRVRRLVLVGAPAGLDRPLPVFIRLWGNPLVGRLISRLRMTDPEELRRRVFPNLVNDPGRLPVRGLQLGIDAAALPGVATTSRTMLAAVSNARGWRPELMMRDAMARLEVPTRFLWGDRDAFAPPSSAHDLAARMPDAEVLELPGLGHMPQLEDPGLVARLTTEFIRASGPARR